MKVIVIANIESQKEFENKGLPEGVEVHFETTVPIVENRGDVYFYLLPEEELLKEATTLSSFDKPVFVSAVINTLHDLPANFIRINAWSGFLERSIVEVSADISMQAQASVILQTLKWNYQIVPDIIGMISARVIAMIINEAYFALGDEVSTKEDIDLAMKLGTNYPYGPFEWGQKIGLQNIVQLLTKLSETENRYAPAAALIKEIRK